MRKNVSLLLLLLLLSLSAISEAASFVFIKKPSSLAAGRTLQRQEQEQQQQHDGLEQRLLQPHSSSFTMLSLRGGSTESNSLVLSKIQNAIRSLLQVLDKRLPLLASLFRAILGVVESIFKVTLIPKPKLSSKKLSSKKKKKKKHRHSKTKSVESTTMSDEQEESSKTTSLTRRKTKNKSSAKKSTPISNKHLTQKLSNKSPNFRIQKELKEFMTNPPPNLKVKVGSNIRIWIVEMQGAAKSIYEGESFRLRVQFPPAYPTVPPSVYFLPPTPQHEHVYTNGDICLSLLGKGWQPSMTAQSIAVSILSILSSAQTKSLPMDNARHSQNKPGQYQQDWVYHDDNC